MREHPTYWAVPEGERHELTEADIRHFCPWDDAPESTRIRRDWRDRQLTHKEES